MFHKTDATAPAKFIGKYNLNHDKGSKEVFGFEPGIESWEHRDNISDLCLFKGADFDSTYVNNFGETLPVWTNHIEPRYPSDNLEITNLRAMYDWVISCKGNPNKFKAELSTWWDVNNVLSYWVITEHFGCTDQRGKNQFPTRFKNGKWMFLFYDAANIIGIDDVGLMAFNYDIESTDPAPGGFIYNAGDSEFWRLVTAAFWPEIAAMYTTLRSGKLTLEYALSIFQGHQADMWVERVYNKDGIVRYIAPLINSGFHFLAQLQGSRTSQRIWWLKNRFQYMDSRFNTGDYKNDWVDIRANTPTNWQGVPPNTDFYLTTNKPGYVHIEFGQSKEARQVRSKPNVQFQVKAPAGLTYNYTEVTFFGASTLKDLGDLSNKYVGKINIEKGVRLERLILGSTVSNYRNETLKEITFKNNPLLKEINLANCYALGAGDSTTPSIDLSKLLVLEKFNAQNTAIKAIVLPEGGTLQELTLPATISNLILRNQTGLTSLVLQGKQNIQSLVADNTPLIDGYALAKEIIGFNFTNPTLNAIRLTDVKINDVDDSYIMKLAMMDGIDEKGDIIKDSPYVTGNAYFTRITQFALDYIKAKFPNLKVTYASVIDKIMFTSSEIETLALNAYDTTKKGYLSSVDVKDKTWAVALANLQENAIFNELRYWRGGTATIANAPKIKGISLATDTVRCNAILNNLQNLEKVMIEDLGEQWGVAAKLTTANFVNTPNIQNFDFYGNQGRYSMSKGGTTLMSRFRDYNGDTIANWIYPIRTVFGNNYTMEDADSLPIKVDIPNTSATFNNALFYTFNNISYLNFGIVNAITNVTINGIARGMKHDFDVAKYIVIQFTNERSGVIKNLTINANTAEDAPLHYFNLRTGVKNALSFERVYINAKCTPDDPQSRFIQNSIGYQSEYMNFNGDVIFGDNYAPALITISGSHDSAFSKLHSMRTLVIKKKTHNGAPYIPTITGGNPYPGIFYSIGTLYVPDENIEAFKAQYIIGGAVGTASYIGKILPLSEWVE